MFPGFVVLAGSRGLPRFLCLAALPIAARLFPLAAAAAAAAAAFPPPRRIAPFSRRWRARNHRATRLALLASTRRLTAINGKPISVPACRRSSARRVSSRNLISSRELTYSPVHERSNSSSRVLRSPGRLLRRARGTAVRRRRRRRVPLEGSRLRPGITAKDRATRGRGK